MRKFVYEMMFSDYQSADDDANAAVDDIRMQGVECLIRTCNLVKESKVDDCDSIQAATCLMTNEVDKHQCRIE